MNFLSEFKILYVIYVICINVKVKRYIALSPFYTFISVHFKMLGSNIQIFKHFFLKFNILYVNWNILSAGFPLNDAEFSD